MMQAFAGTVAIPCGVLGRRGSVTERRRRRACGVVGLRAAVRGEDGGVADLDALRAYVIEKRRIRVETIRADSEAKKVAWMQEMDALRTKKVVDVGVGDGALGKAGSWTAKRVESRVERHVEAVAKVQDKVEKKAQAVVEAVHEPVKAATTAARGKAEAGAAERAESAVERHVEAFTKVQEKVEKSSQAAVDAVKEPAKTAIPDASAKPGAAATARGGFGVERHVQDVPKVQEKFQKSTQAAVDAVKNPVKAVSTTAPARAKSAAKKTADKATEPANLAATLGGALLDAIVEGVPATPPAAEKEKVSEKKKTELDMADLQELVKSGKIKNLTVTKLRRLLSASRLKQNGRKAELIARLTSFAKAP